MLSDTSGIACSAWQRGGECPNGKRVTLVLHSLRLWPLADGIAVLTGASGLGIRRRSPASRGGGGGKRCARRGIVGQDPDGSASGCARGSAAYRVRAPRNSASPAGLDAA